jgi:hypothetical protein
MTLVGQAADASVWMYDGSGSWTRIRGASAGIYAGGVGLIAQDGFTSEPWKYTGTPNQWEQIGAAGWSFAVSDHGVFRLASDRQSVWGWDGGTSWNQIGGPASNIYAGSASVAGGSLVATNPSTGELWAWTAEPNQWELIGPPGEAFGVGYNTVYSIAPPDRYVWAYDGSGTSWTRIGGPAANIYVGNYGLVATNPSTGNLYLYGGTPNYWEQIGGPGAEFAVDDQTVYGLTPNREAVYAYDGSGMSWTWIGAPGSGGPASYIIGYKLAYEG